MAKHEPQSHLSFKYIAFEYTPNIQTTTIIYNQNNHIDHHCSVWYTCHTMPSNCIFILSNGNITPQRIRSKVCIETIENCAYRDRTSRTTRRQVALYLCLYRQRAKLLIYLLGRAHSGALSFCRPSIHILKRNSIKMCLR